MRAKALIAVIGVAIASPASANPPADPAEWLVRMGEAARSANYQGTIVYQGDDMLETMRVTHRFENGVERERVQSLTGAPREIHKQDSKVTCLLPKDRKLTMERPTPKGLFPGLTRERVQQIAAIYDFHDYGTARLAGRQARGMAITPKDEFRYGYEVWADEATNVPLKVNLLGKDGAVLEQMMFTEVEFPDRIPDSAFRTELDRAEFREVTRNEPGRPPVQPQAVGWQFDQLPPGFRVMMRDVRTLPDGKGTVEHLLLSDGLSAVSIFSSRKDDSAHVFRGVSQMGAVHAYGRMTGRFHITVVGEAPPQTVRMIGDGLKPASEQPVAAEQAQPAEARRP